MSRFNRERSSVDPRLPQGTAIMAALVAVLAAGVYLIISGLV